jgi:hypothetical protein
MRETFRSVLARLICLALADVASWNSTFVARQCSDASAMLTARP